MAEQLVGSVTHYFAEPGVGVVAITDGAVEVGDTIHVVGAHSDFTMKVASLEIDHAPVESAGVGSSVGVKMAERVREHDRVFVVT